MEHKSHFEMRRFFICPKCNRPIISEEDVEKRIELGHKYCGRCGNEIAHALAEARAEINANRNKLS